MTLERIIDICKAYNMLGDAIAEQLDDALDGDMGDCNVNALVDCKRFLRKVREHADCNGDDELREDVEDAIEEITDAIEDDDDA